MKLFFVFPISGPNNGVKVISNHIRNMLFENSNISLVTVDTSQAKDFNNFGKFNFSKLQNFIRLLKKFLKISKGDMVYLNLTPKGFAFYRDLIFLFVCRLRTKNITIHIHANGLENNIKWYNAILFSKIKIIVINKKQKEKLNPYCNNIFMVPNSLPDYYMDKKFELSENQTLSLIFISNLSKEKGVFRLKKICEFISNKNIICNINIYGGSLTENDSKLINELDNIYPFLKAHGPVVEDIEKFKYLQKSDALIFLSDEFYEVYPLVYIEALMNGLTILTTNQVVSENLCDLGVAKVINEDLSHFEAILNGFIDNPKGLTELKSKSRDVYEKNYSFINFINKIEEIITYEI